MTTTPTLSGTAEDTVSTPILKGEGVFDPFKKLNEKQMAAFKEIKENLSDLTDPEDVAWMDDMCLLRYLRARNYNVAKSEKLLRGTLEWRQKYRPQDVKLTEVADIAKTGCLYIHGKDLKGRPILMARPRRDNVKGVSNADKFKHLVYWLEHGFRQMDKSRGVEQFCFIVDYNEFSRKNLDMNTNLESMHLLLDHCPERMGQSLFLDPPTLFWFAWKVISPFLNEVTLSKVKFCYSKKVNGKRVYPDLADYISMDQMEQDLGGENPTSFNYDDFIKEFHSETTTTTTTSSLSSTEEIILNGSSDQPSLVYNQTSTATTTTTTETIHKHPGNTLEEPMTQLAI
ncbi:cellular retinaldehyde-binding/triple function domain-containing protein [Cavenderia fasciculata]|uniref:Cellular retinaldehyde-binding/triple function domain-containing protein n=1 Tax=Cavenderia fasciculata TaxID=261658 RepID=F4PHD4_CACFS|nr:cellular retinaldehyde-binding/triple function domain-containing protein [Cavenderia fasciculata]EGG25118.1 cellular retinaldehyde-binding/triple function domain-containing protein [Cavenderia fasciculata]|eukprot:XP_004362969.1 cellular retinaldehyde-binding/triple function domain-containing protein [Cavenderia fasciculata]